MPVDEEGDGSDRKAPRTSAQREMITHNAFLNANLEGYRTYTQPLRKALRPHLRPFHKTIQLLSSTESEMKS